MRELLKEFQEEKELLGVNLIACPRNARKISTLFDYAGLPVTVCYEKHYDPSKFFGELYDLKEDAVVPHVNFTITGDFRMVIDHIRPGEALVGLWYYDMFRTMYYFRKGIRVLMQCHSGGVKVSRVPWEISTIDEAQEFLAKYRFKTFWAAAGREKYVATLPYQKIA